MIDPGRVGSWPDKERGICVSGWEVGSCGGLKGGEEGELISELKSNIRKKKKKVFYAGNGRRGELVNYSPQGKCSSFPVFVKKALLAHS